MNIMRALIEMATYRNESPEREIDLARQEAETPNVREDAVTGVDTGGDRSVLTGMTPEQLSWISSLIRMQIRKLDRNIAHIHAREGQRAAEVAAFRESLAAKRRFAERALEALYAVQAARRCS